MAAAVEVKSDVNPYVGPRPFERREEDRARFFGRDREVDEIVSLVVSHPLVLVYAQSGAGKTSLFNTAVADALEQKRFSVLPLARVSGGTIGEFDPDKIQNLYVFNALLCIDADVDRDEAARMSLAEFLRRSGGDDANPRALVFDQFEELFTFELVYELYGDAWQEQQEAFFQQVAEAVAADPLLRVVFLMRKEYLAELERYERLLPERLQTRFQLEPLDREQALEAVEGPLRGTPRTFADGVAEKLVDRLLAMRVGPGRNVRGRFVQPVHLQLVCRRLWQDLPAEAMEITDEDVRAFGDVDLVLEQFYDRAVTAAAKSAYTREWKLRGKIESDFITSIGTRGTVYRTRDWERLAAALDELEARHVVSAEWRAGTRWYELAHDRLIDPIRTSNERFRARVRRRWTRVAAVFAATAVAAGAAVGAYFIWGVTGPPAASPLLLATVTTRGGDILAAAPIGDSGGIETINRSGPVQVARVGASALSFQAGDGAITAAAFAPGGGLLLVARGKTVEEWNPATATRLVTASSAALGTRSAIGFSSNGRLAAMATRSGVNVFDTGSVETTYICGFLADVTSVALDADGRMGAVGLASGFGAVEDARCARRFFRAGKARIEGVALSPDGKWFAGAVDDGTVHVWSVGSGKLVSTIPISSKPLEAVAFSPDGRLIAVGGRDVVAHVFRWRPFNGAIALGGHKDAVTAVSFSPDGNEVVTISKDNTAKVWGYFGAAATVRGRIVAAALAGVGNAGRIHYAQIRPMPGVGTVFLPDIPTQFDSSGFVTWCYSQAGAPDPNGTGYNGVGYTGTLLAHMRHIPQSRVRPGDLVVFGPPPGHHVALVVSAGENPTLVSDGNESGPLLVQFSDERAFQPGPVTWLTENLG